MNILATIALLLGTAAAASEVRLSRLPSKAYELHGSFEVAASSVSVWEVLTDYEGIPAFVSSMKSSKILEKRGDGSALVEQKATGGMFFVKRTVTILLEVKRGPQSLEFEDVGRESFWRYEGGWTTEPALGGVKVAYRLLAQPDFVAPSLFMSRAMKRGARDLLDQVRSEIVRRGSKETKP